MVGLVNLRAPRVLAQVLVSALAVPGEKGAAERVDRDRDRVAVAELSVGSNRSRITKEGRRARDILAGRGGDGGDVGERIRLNVGRAGHAGGAVEAEGVVAARVGGIGLRALKEKNEKKRIGPKGRGGSKDRGGSKEERT